MLFSLQHYLLHNILIVVAQAGLCYNVIDKPINYAINYTINYVIKYMSTMPSPHAWDTLMIPCMCYLYLNHY